MAAVKKTVAPKKAPAKKAPVKKDRNEVVLPKLAQEDLLRLRLFDAQAKLAMQEVQLKAQERAKYLTQIDPQNRLATLEQMIADAQEQHRVAKTSYAQALQAASKKVGVDLSSGCAIDPETGTVIRHEAKKE